MTQEDEAIYRLMEATNQIDGSYYLCARRLGEKANTMALLYALSDGRPHSQKQVSRDWLIPKTTVNTIVKELEQKGLARLADVPSREKAIELTPAGHEHAACLLEGVWAAERAALARTLERYPAEFVDAFACFSSCLAQELARRVPAQEGGGRKGAD